MDVDDAVHHLAGAQQLHQLAGPVDGGQGVHGVQALFITWPEASVRMPRARAVRRMEVPLKLADSKTTVRGVVHDLAVLAAHDAGQAHGPCLVGDDQHGWR